MFNILVSQKIYGQSRWSTNNFSFIRPHVRCLRPKNKGSAYFHPRVVPRDLLEPPPLYMQGKMYMAFNQ